MRKIIIATTLLAAGIAWAAAPTTRPASLPTTSISKHPAIVHIVSRDKTVTISSGPNGLLYSLAGERGQVLVADASGDDFARLHPELYQAIRQYIAVKNDAGSATAAASASTADELPVGVPLADLDASR
jgi:hypothetical protein